MTYEKSQYHKIIFITVFVFLFHLLFLNFNPVNFEFSFSEGAKYIYSYDKNIIKDYFFNQANTFVFPIFVGIIDSILFINNTLITARLLSASSYVFLALGFLNVFKYYKIKVSISNFLIFFFLNPLIWTYGHRGIPDLFAVSLAFYSFSNILYYESEKTILNYINFFLLGFSICLKPFCLIYLGLIFLLKFNKNLIINFKKYYLLYLVSLSLPIIYFYLIKSNFDFYLIPKKFSSEVSFLKGGFFNNFFGYFIFLSIFIFPITFKRKFINKVNIFVVLILIIPMSFYFHFLTNSPSTELNFGFLSKIFDVRIIIFFGLTSLFIFFLYLIDNKTQNLEFFFVVFIYIFILSFTRSSQRYLIPILPIAFMFFLINMKLLKLEIFFFLISLIYIILNFFISINFYLNSSINKEIIEYLTNKDIIGKTLPGPLYAHSYHYFLSKDNKSFIISADPSDQLKSFKKKFFIIEKNYFLRENK